MPVPGAAHASSYNLHFQKSLYGHPDKQKEALPLYITVTSDCLPSLLKLFNIQNENGDRGTGSSPILLHLQEHLCPVPQGQINQYPAGVLLPWILLPYNVHPLQIRSMSHGAAETESGTVAVCFTSLVNACRWGWPVTLECITVSLLASEQLQTFKDVQELIVYNPHPCLPQACLIISSICLNASLPLR